MTLSKRIDRDGHQPPPLPAGRRRWKRLVCRRDDLHPRRIAPARLRRQRGKKSIDPAGIDGIIRQQLLFQLSAVVRIHSGHPPPLDEFDGLPSWLKTPGNGSSVVPGVNGPETAIRLNATLGRFACRFTRILNLVRLTIHPPHSGAFVKRFLAQYPHGHQQVGRRPANFRLVPLGGADDRHHPLAITPNEGIVFVDHHSDADAAGWTGSNASFTVRVDWDIQQPPADGDSAFIRTALIRIDVVGSPSVESFASAPHRFCDPGLYCSEFRSEQDCQSVGMGSIGTDQRGCSWRSSGTSSGSSSSSAFSRSYATCSPDLSTCPDGYCDDLEGRAWEICPQDCTGELPPCSSFHPPVSRS